MKEYKLVNGSQVSRVRYIDGEYETLIGQNWQKLPIKKEIIESQIEEYGVEVEQKGKVEVAAIAAVKMVPPSTEDKLGRAKRYVPAYFNTEDKKDCINIIRSYYERPSRKTKTQKGNQEISISARKNRERLSSPG